MRDQAEEFRGRVPVIAPSYWHSTNKVLATRCGKSVGNGMFEILSDDYASVRERPALESQIETMRHDVQVLGECIVPYDEISSLCEDARPPRNQWEEIAKIAIGEGWTFTFFPDRSVRFAKL